MPPFRSAQTSGIPWGLGTDAGIVSPYQAFFTLYFAVTGKDAAGRVILKDQTVTREEALIAHTRTNAYLLFQEDNLGTIEPGKYADLVQRLIRSEQIGAVVPHKNQYVMPLLGESFVCV